MASWGVVDNPVVKKRRFHSNRPPPPEDDNEAETSTARQRPQARPIRLDVGTIGAATLKAVQESSFVSDGFLEGADEEEHQVYSFQRPTSNQEASYGYLNGQPGTKGKRRHRLEWKFAAENKRGINLQQIKPPQKAFPGTIDLERGVTDGLLTSELVQQGMRYLKTTHPTLDIPYSIISAEYAEMKSSSSPVSSFSEPAYDPYRGNKMSSTTRPYAHRRPMGNAVRYRSMEALVAFAMGSNGDELNISQMVYHGRVAAGANDSTRDLGHLSYFRPAIKPVIKFTMPIQQIRFAPSDLLTEDGHISSAISLAVRTHSSMNFLAIKDPDTDSKINIDLQATVVGSLTYAETNGRRPIDMSASQWDACRTVVIDDGGGIYEWYLESGRYNVVRKGDHKRFSRRRSAEQAVNPFHRISYGSSNSVVYWASEKEVRMLDFRDPSSNVLIYDTRGSSAGCIFTCFDSYEEEELNPVIHGMATTDSVLWIDHRMPGRGPLLEINHNRKYDRSLMLESVNVDGVRTTFLSSTRNSFMSSYTVNYSDGIVQSLSDPYMLDPPSHSSTTSFERIGMTFIRNPQEKDTSYVNLFELSSFGEVWLRKLGNDDKNFNYRNLPAASMKKAELTSGIEWNAKMKLLDDNRRQAAQRVEETELRERKLVDFQKLHDQVFNVNKIQSVSSAESSQEAAKAVQSMSNFIRDLEVPLDGLVTVHDISYISTSTEEAPTSRSDFFNPTPLNPSALSILKISNQLAEIQPNFSKQSGYTFFPTKRFATLAGTALSPPPNGEVAEAASTLQPFIQFDKIPDFSEQLKGEFCIKKLPKGAKSQSTRFTPATARAEAACDALALDLALSCQIYSDLPLIKDEHPGVVGIADLDAILQRAAQNMSLNDDAPGPIPFGVLKPVSQSHKHHKGQQSRISNNDLEDESSSEGEDDGDGDDLAVKAPLAARMILSDWVVGQDVSAYKWIDFRTAEETDEDLSLPKPQQSQRSTTTSQSQSQLVRSTFGGSFSQEIYNSPQSYGQQPPMVASVGPSNTQPPSLRWRLPDAAGPSSPAASNLTVRFTGALNDRPPIQSTTQATQLLGSGARDLSGGRVGGDSQESLPDFARSQIEPGKFGGRISTGGGGTKKLKPKKRLGGF